MANLTGVLRGGILMIVKHARDRRRYEQQREERQRGKEATN
jgi:hypothetical protein